jgi:hypothetical protein
MSSYAKPFETKDSGQRAEYASGMVRDASEDKAHFEFLLWPGLPYEEQFLTRWAQLMTRGMRKYGSFNFTKANSTEELQRFKESAFRHLIQWMTGDETEDHAAAVAYNVSSAEHLKAKMRSQERDAAEEG